MSGESLDRLRQLLRKGAHGLGLEEVTKAPCCGEFGTGSGEHSRECPEACSCPPGKHTADCIMMGRYGGRPKGESVTPSVPSLGTTTSIVSSTFLAYKDTKSDKVYTVFIQHRYSAIVHKDVYEVYADWGRRDGHMERTLKSSHATLRQASAAADRLVQSKRRKGYKTVSP